MLPGMTPGELNTMHRDIRAGLRGGVEKAVALGHALLAARAGLPHGAWLPWVRKNLDFGGETARNYASMAGHPDLAARCTSVRQFLRKVRFRRHLDKRREAAERGRSLHTPDWCALHAVDFRGMPGLLPAGCASLCVADPVWDEGHLGDYAAIDAAAAALLKPRGVLLVYYSRGHLPAVLASFRRLRFLDQLFVVYSAPKQLWTTGGMVCRTRPVLAFCQGDRPAKGTYKMHDTQLGTVAGAKEYHKWEQDEPALRYWAGHFTDPGDTVVDLCVGGGTLAAACHALKGRTYHGCDTDPAALAVTRQRLADLDGRDRLDAAGPGAAAGGLAVGGGPAWVT